MFLRAAIFSACMLSVSEAWLIHTLHVRTSFTVRHFGASGAQEDRHSDLSPEILGSPQWLENLTKTHRTGYYPASWSSTLKPEKAPSALSQQYYSTNQYYNEPGSMLSRKSALSSPSPGRPSWSSPSTNVVPTAALSSFSSSYSKSSELPSNSNLMHPDVSTKIRIQYCPTSVGESVPPCTPPAEPIAPSFNSHRQLTTPLTSADTALTDTPVLEPDTLSSAPTTTTITMPEAPLPYPEHQMMSFLDGGQHILHGNIAEFAEVKSQRNLEVVQAKKELFQQDTPFTRDDGDSVTAASEQKENRTEEIAENEVLEIDNREDLSLHDAELRQDALKDNEPRSEKEEFFRHELARWEEAARRDALRKVKKNDTMVHRSEDEGIDLNGLEWCDDESSPDAESLD